MPFDIPPDLVSNYTYDVNYYDMDANLDGGGAWRKFKNTFRKRGGRRALGGYVENVGGIASAAPDPRVAAAGHALQIGGKVLQGSGTRLAGEGTRLAGAGFLKGLKKAGKGALKNRDTIMALGEIVAEEAGYEGAAGNIGKARRLNQRITGGGTQLAGAGFLKGLTKAGKSALKNRDTIMALGEIVAEETGNYETANKLGKARKLNQRITGGGTRLAGKGTKLAQALA